MDKIEAFMAAVVVSMILFVFYSISQMIYHNAGFKGLIIAVGIVFIFGYIWMEIYKIYGDND